MESHAQLSVLISYSWSVLGKLNSASHSFSSCSFRPIILSTRLQKTWIHQRAASSKMNHYISIWQSNCQVILQDSIICLKCQKSEDPFLQGNCVSLDFLRYTPDIPRLCAHMTFIILCHYMTFFKYFLLVHPNIRSYKKKKK